MNSDILSNLVITRFLSASDMYNSENTRTKRTDRPSWAMVMKYEGETEYYNNGAKYVSNVTNAVILSKGSTYEWRCTKAGHYAIVEFDADLTCNSVFSCGVTDSNRILRLFRELEYKQSLKSPMINAELIRDCYNMLLQFTRMAESHYLPTDKQQRIAPAVEYIIKNCNRVITNDELAELAGMSTVYFRKLFSETQGESPIAFAKRLRINKAKEMLKSDYGSIGEIAYSLGYQNIYDFSRDFKKHTGMSPTEYSRN